MDQNRWPHPGPGMVVVFGVVGLIAGILAGLFNPSGTPTAAGDPGEQRSKDTVVTRTTLPSTFYTVVLASISRSRERSEAEARAQAIRDQGVEEVGVLDPDDYTSLGSNFWAVYSGVFETQREAAARRDQLRSSYPDLAGAYLKTITNDS